MNIQTSPPTPIDQMVEKAVIDLGIPPCPAILNRFMTEVRKDEPDYNRLTSIICSDVSLSASLLKTANSPYFGARQRVRSVHDALVILGLNTASRAVAGIILRKTFPTVPNMERFWDASSRFARLSGWLSQRFEMHSLAADAYTFGLFRDCGIPVLLQRLPSYESVLQAANNEVVRSFTQIEDDVLPTNHAMVGCVLAQSWWLPEEISLAIRHHHDLSVLSTTTAPPSLDSRKLIAVTQLAEHLVQQQLHLSFTQEWSKLGEACLNLLGIEESDLETLATEAVPVISAEE